MNIKQIVTKKNIKIKFQTIELKIDAMLEIGASKNLLFKILVSQEDQQTLTQSVKLTQYN